MADDALIEVPMPPEQTTETCVDTCNATQEDVADTLATDWSETVELRQWLLPEGGKAAHEAFLSLLHSPGDTWVLAYNLSDPDFLNEIDIADANGVKGHILADRIQSAGPSEHALLWAHAAKWKNWDVTITTAMTGPSPGQIFHHKEMIVDDPAGGEPWIWTGSANFSTFKAAWCQGNHCAMFRSAISADNFLRYFDEHKAVARKVHPDWSPPQPLWIDRPCDAYAARTAPAGDTQSQHDQE